MKRFCLFCAAFVRKFQSYCPECRRCKRCGRIIAMVCGSARCDCTPHGGLHIEQVGKDGYECGVNRADAQAEDYIYYDHEFEHLK